MTDAGAGAGASPLIAGTDMSANGDFSEFFEYDDEPLAAAAVANASAGSPYHHTALNFDLGLSQDHQAFRSFNQKVVDHHPNAAPSTLAATDIPAAESPESLNDDSFRDSSSDSDSSKRTGSSSSDKTDPTVAGDIVMAESAGMKPDWDTAPTNGHPPPFYQPGPGMPNAASSASHPPLDDPFGLGGQSVDDAFMNESFDFESASGSPAGPVQHTPSQTQSPVPQQQLFSNKSPPHDATPSKTHPPAHAPNASQFSLTQPMHGLKMTGSREASPLTHNMMGQQQSSPAFFNNSPSPTAMPDMSKPPMVAPMNGHPMWPAHMDGLQTLPPGYAMIPQFNPQLMQQMAMMSQPNYSPMPYYCKLHIHETPAKSRVETQIPIKMTLLGAPPVIKRLHLPTHTISKPKLLAKPPAEPSPDMLELYAQLVCTSSMQNEENKRRALQRAAAAPHPSVNDASPDDDNNEETKTQNGGEVRICAGCITRERKRAGRKKLKKIEEEEMWRKDENRRVIVFNTREIKDWQRPSLVTNPSLSAQSDQVNAAGGALEVDAPMRIACYCRHHSEKLGFQVIFTLKDWHGRVVAQAMSPSIMITDDHKTHPIPQAIHAPAPDNSMVPMMNPPPVDNAPMNAASLFPSAHANAELQGLPQKGPMQMAGMAPQVKGPTPPAGPIGPSSSSLSRPVSPTSGPGPASKKRKASGSRVPMEMAMTRLDTPAPASVGQTQSTGQSSANVSAATSPFTPTVNVPTIDGFFGQNQATTPTAPPALSAGSLTPNNANHHVGNVQDQNPFSSANRSVSMNDLSMPLFSAPTSAHPSRAPSPNRLRQSLGGLPQNSLAHSLASGLSYMGNGSAATRPQPTIHKIIPNEGPKMGGIEVTILGGNFFQGLDVYFGDHKATTTTYWGESSLVCLLPPATRAGIVPVTLKQPQTQPQAFTPGPTQMFKYTDDEEAELTKLMLGMISQKMTGQLLDVRTLAQRIMGQSELDAWSGLAGNSGAGFGGNNFSMSTESQLMKCLELNDLDDGPRIARLDLRRATGQTMLHLGCSLGYHRFVAGLLARGANPDLRDKGGFTPMHMAAIGGHEAIVRRLMQAGADPTIRSLSGLRPADVAVSRKVIEHIRRCERHVRSRSGGSLFSRNSSAASLRSLWDSHAVSDDSDNVADGEESPEYSSGDYEDDEDVDDSWLDMRRASATSAQNATLDRRQSNRTNQEQDDLHDAPDSPRTALAASVRDQFTAQLQQFQQTMAAMHLPNLSQMPNLPQMPTLPRMLPDYQAYLQQHPFMGRMTSLMPGMSGSRPGSAGDDESKPMDLFRWWGDIAAMLNNNNNNNSSSSVTAPPPSYSELFPRDAADKKQALAAQAAAEAEADNKCARLYDTEPIEAEEDEMGESSVSQETEPKALKIGRKKAITREQQQDILRAHAAKFKGVRSDKNLWFIWIPLLTCLLAAMLYIRFPQVYTTAWSTARSFLPARDVPTTVRNIQDRVVEV